MVMEIISFEGDMLFKVALFVLVQALVYLILSQSSTIFSKTPTRSFSFRPARSVSIRRLAAMLADIPAGGEPSPSSKDLKSPTQEQKMKPHSSGTISAPSKLAVYHDSHVIIPKFKPKIRITHIFPPKLIKTDVANFRELVQRLTGKPANRKDRGKNSSSLPSKGSRTKYPKRCRNIKGSQDGINFLQNGVRMKKECEEMYGGYEDSNGFVDMDCLIQDLSEFPLLPFTSSQINIFGEMPISY
ncbi:unnamed protein product [Ilex paraguariensis]|uniref:VQ domain-containing protein n=1 Tax=Ilex paraguariensis TaxID=185542 RepID=A0ABC8UCX4_9AQUA